MTKFFTLISLIACVSCGQSNNEKEKTYQAGFSIIHTVDTARLYKPGTDTSDYLHYRPIDVDIWYPANSSPTDTSLAVRDILGLLEQRANYYSASNVGKGITGQLAQFFCEGFKCSDSSRLLQFKTNSIKNAPAANGPFPLVIYMTAFNGMSYENYALFEALANNGFVVVSISSIGRFPGDMTMKNADLMEQVDDASIAIKLLTQNKNIDATNIGIVGYSWGGLAGAVLAGRTPHVKGLVSLEGSEFHHYGNAKDEDADFDSIKNNASFKDLRISVPYLRLESAPVSQPGKIDSVYNFTANHVAGPQVYTVDSAQHEDFDCFSLIVRQSGNCTLNQRYPSALKLTLSFLEDQLKNKNTFAQTLEQEMNKTIRKKK